MNNTDCSQLYGPIITENMMCTSGKNAKGSCFGDSGGPAIVKNDAGFYVQVKNTLLIAVFDSKDWFYHNHKNSLRNINIVHLGRHRFIWWWNLWRGIPQWASPCSQIFWLDWSCNWTDVLNNSLFLYDEIFILNLWISKIVLKIYRHTMKLIQK